MTDYKAAAIAEVAARAAFRQLVETLPMTTAERLDNPGLFISRQTWGRFLFMQEIYSRIVGVHGVVMEFGVRWGQNLALFANFRGLYEPYNHNRRIVGFDTFSGFPGVDAKDGDHPAARANEYSVAAGHEAILDALLAYHESESPIPHIKKFELVKGDVIETLPAYLERHPETIVALAYFDLDIYAPTKACLERIRPHLVKGSVLAFDELNHAPWPGETLAVAEVLGLPNLRLQRLPYAPTPSFVVVE